jgi:2,3-bisphosphoglycerate-independent phosphoglycerate mutase
VPVTICGPEVRPDDLKKFDERSCARGGLGKFLGKDLMPIILNLMNKSEKFGA